MKLNTPKGTRDFSPAEMVRRNYIFDTIKSVFKKYGYQPIETPAMENSETLMGKYGDEGDRLIFKILESGDFLKDAWRLLDDNGNLVEVNKSEIVFIEKDLQKLKNFLFEKITGFISSRREEAKTFEDLDFLMEMTMAEISVNVGGYFFSDKSDVYNEIMLLLRFGYLKYITESVDLFAREEGTEPFSRYFNYLTAKDRDALDACVQSDLDKFFSDDEFTLRITALLIRLEAGKLAKYISAKAMRYDLTVPFARYVVQHRNEITFPFKRYQVQPVWRADRPQKGRYREFYQCDIDVIGSDSLLNEVEMVQVTDEVFSKLNVPVTLKINNRKLLAAIAEVIGAPNAFVDITVALDKLDKIGEEKVCNELKERGISDSSIEKLLPLMRFSGNTSEKLEFLKTYLGENETGQKGIAEVSEVLETAQRLISNKTVLELDLTLARGLNYYTGAIFEVRSNIEGTLSSSISGGGRYDDLTGIFGMPDVSGVGISFGADRIYDVLEGAILFPEFTSDSTQVFFVNFGEKEAAYCLGLVKQLREAGINTELYPDKAKMQKQMTYANNNGIPFVAMVGTQEMESGKIGLKNMTTGKQSSVTITELISML